ARLVRARGEHPREGAGPPRRGSSLGKWSTSEYGPHVRSLTDCTNGFAHVHSGPRSAKTDGGGGESATAPFKEIGCVLARGSRRAGPKRSRHVTLRAY